MSNHQTTIHICCKKKPLRSKVLVFFQHTSATNFTPKTNLSSPITDMDPAVNPDTAPQCRERVVFRPVCARVDFEQTGWGLLSNLLDIYFTWKQICRLSAPPLIYIYTHAVPYGEALKLCCKKQVKRGLQNRTRKYKCGREKKGEQTWIKNRD